MSHTERARDSGSRAVNTLAGPALVGHPVCCSVNPRMTPRSRWRNSGTGGHRGWPNVPEAELGFEPGQLAPCPRVLMAIS